MNTKLLMTTSAILLALSGIVFTFLPDEVIVSLGLEVNNTLILLLQTIGAMYFAFGMLNWMTKSSLIGGIYNRPIALANFIHFMITGIALTKSLFSNVESATVIRVAGIVYILFAVLFGIILFRHPIAQAKAQHAEIHHTK